MLKSLLIYLIVLIVCWIGVLAYVVFRKDDIDLDTFTFMVAACIVWPMTLVGLFFFGAFTCVYYAFEYLYKGMIKLRRKIRK